jgi:hypothetical protein
LDLIQLEFALGKNKIGVTMAILPFATEPGQTEIA